MAIGGGGGISVSGPGGSVRLTFEIVGGERLDVTLSRFGQEVSDWRPFFREEVAPKFFETLQSNLAGQGSYVGGYAPLSEPYGSWKAQHYPGKTILRREDQIYNSLTWSGGPGPGGVYRDSPSSVEMGTSVPHAGPHQVGSGRLPVRKIVFLPVGASESYGRLAHRWVVAQAKAAGLNTSAGSQSA